MSKDASQTISLERPQVKVRTESRRRSQRAYYLRNREHLKQKARVQASAPDKKAAKKLKNNAWRIANAEKLRAYRKWHAKEHRAAIRKTKRAYHAKKMATDPKYAMKHRLRTRLSDALRLQRSSKSAATLALVGCSMEFLVAYLEARFKPGMTWENKRKWHVDHIIPCAKFDLTDPAQQRACFHYSNLQPMWAKKNQQKGVSFKPLLQPELL